MRFPHPHECAASLRAVAVLAAGLATAGCVTHEARVVPPTAPTLVAGQTLADTTTVVVIGTTQRYDLVNDHVARDCLPIDIPVSAWRREADGSVSRYEGHSATPLPWWQRFPFDAVADALPMEFTAGATATVVLVPVPTVDKAAFLTQARRDGYASAADSAPKPQQP